MNPLTHYYNKLNMCRECFDKYVVEYAIAVEPPYLGDWELDSYVGKCDLCKTTTLLIKTKYVTILGKKP